MCFPCPVIYIMALKTQIICPYFKCDATPIERTGFWVFPIHIMLSICIFIKKDADISPFGIFILMAKLNYTNKYIIRKT